VNGADTLADLGEIHPVWRSNLVHFSKIDEERVMGAVGR
jgi:hypothetical protein